MDDDAHIRITEYSIELGESTIPSQADEFTSWIRGQLSDHEDASTAEIRVEFAERQALDDVHTFLENVDASTDLRADVSNVTLVIRTDEE